MRQYSHPNMSICNSVPSAPSLTTEVEAEMALLDASGMGGPDVVMPTLDRNRAQ